jgi:RNA polymerase sigma-70 factor (ECF subfamily)
LHRFLAKRLHRAQTADIQDLAQEVFMRLVRLDDAEFVRNPRAYLLGIANHVVCEFLDRSRSVQKWVSFDSSAVERLAETPSELQPPDEAAQRLSTQRQVRAALEQLKPMHRAVLLLRKREGYSYAEIAKRLDLSTRQVERYMDLALAQLKTVKWDR